MFEDSPQVSSSKRHFEHFVDEKCNRFFFTPSAVCYN